MSPAGCPVLPEDLPLCSQATGLCVKGSLSQVLDSLLACKWVHDRLGVTEPIQNAGQVVWSWLGRAE